VGTPGPRADLLDALFTLVRHWPDVWQVPGVPEASAAVVRCFRSEEADLTVGDVSRVLGVAPSTASRLVSAAVRSGHVGKGRTAGRGRFVVVTLTAVGRDLLVRLVEQERSALAAATPAWSARERWQARALLLDLAGGLADDRGEPPDREGAGGSPEGAAVRSG
jgi:DNA-binding MarR family transcriptional regulator